MKHTKSDVTLFCFSPFIMLLTFVIELSLAAVVWWRTRASISQRLILLILICLATFQAAEYIICTGGHDIFWTKLGLTAITLLPALGLHLMGHLTKKPAVVSTGYLMAAAYSGIFLFMPEAVLGASCEGNYVILNTQYAGGWGAYYFFFLFVAVGKALQHLRHTPIKKGGNRSRSIAWLMVGYLSFILPMFIAFIARPEIREATPSVMCGFAVILAFILAGILAPLSEKIDHGKSGS